MKKNQIFYTYILVCSDGTYYTGITNDLTQRLRQHNGEIVGGARYTRSRRPVQLQYWEENSSRSEAAKREFILRKLSHIEKQYLQSAQRLHSFKGKRDNLPRDRISLVE